MLELYHHGTSVCAAKPRIVLAEKGLAWTGHYVDILKGEQFAAGYAELNPRRVVPTLVHDGQVIRESTLICEYLDEVFPDPPLKPFSPIDRVAMRMWTKRIDEEIHATAVGPITFAISHRHAVISAGEATVDYYVNQGAPSERARRRQRLERGLEDADVVTALRIYDRFLADIETQLSHTAWLAGDSFSLAEASVTPYINRLDALQLSGMWTAHRPFLTDWWARLKARPSFAPALVKYVPPELALLMKICGDKAWPKVCAILHGAA